MGRVASEVDAVRQYLQKRIDRCSMRIKRTKKAMTAPPHGEARRVQLQTASVMAARSAYRDALRALNAIPSDVGVSEVRRLAAGELERVKSALALIYEVTQHGNHDIADGQDWATVEGEAQGALNILHEAERGAGRANDPPRLGARARSPRHSTSRSPIA